MKRLSGTAALLPPFLLGLVLSGMVDASPAGAQKGGPWESLEILRNSLQKAGPMTAEFIQTYVAAGSPIGDEEKGHWSIWLPDCLRWSYTEPRNKQFLVCQEEVYYWTTEEPGGRHHRIDPEHEPGLDLWLVPVTALRERYIAESEKLQDGSYRITLAVPSQSASRFSARIRLDPTRTRVMEFEYTDDEGNLTRVRLADYQPLRDTALFRPPPGVAWTEQ